MQRECMIEGQSIYFEERKRASEIDWKLASRDRASELLDMSVSNLSSIELGKHKSVPPDVVLRMAELYNAPRLINHYCINDCPLGCIRGNTLSSAVETMEKIAIHFIGELKTKDVEKYINYVIDIAQDGEITEDELSNCYEIEEYFDRFCKTYSEFKIRLDMARGRVA